MENILNWSAPKEPDGVDHPAVDKGVERDEAVRVEIAPGAAGRRFPLGVGLVAPVAERPPRGHPPGPDPHPALGPQDRPGRRIGRGRSRLMTRDEILGRGITHPAGSAR